MSTKYVLHAKVSKMDTKCPNVLILWRNHHLCIIFFRKRCVYFGSLVIMCSESWFFTM